LWKRFTNPTSCAVTRQICCYYIGSFLSRAKYIPLNTCIATLQLIVTWIHNYINKTGNNFSNFDLHRTFYALSQTLFYIIIFRQRQLFQEGQSETLDLIKSWKLNEIINSKLNPLLYCLPTVIKKFARITYINQVAYCYSIIDSNNRVSLPTVSSQALSSNSKRMFFSSQNESFNSDGSNSKQVEWKNNNNNKTKKNENPLDSFFPFDPYLLKCSGKHIESIYQEFIDIISDEDSEEETEDEEDDENEDDEEEEDDEMDEDDDDGNEETNKSNDCILRKKPLNNQSHLDDSDIDNSLDGDDF
jgi:RNA polymerase I-specific transcription initiation factor RRN3